MLKKINHRYLCYDNGEIVYVLDLDSNLFSLIFGLSHTNFNKKGYIVDEYPKVVRLNEKKEFSISTSGIVGISLLSSFTLRLIFGEALISNLFAKVIFICIPLMVMILFRITWSKKERKKTLKLVNIKKEVCLKINFDKSFRGQRFLSILVLHSLFYVLTVIAAIVFLFSGSVQMYIVYLLELPFMFFLGVIGIQRGIVSITEVDK